MSKKVLIALVLQLFWLNALPFSARYNIPYFKYLKKSEYVIKARVVAEYQLTDTLMIMAVVKESFNLNPSQFCINDTITLHVISGMECMPFLSSFDKSSDYYFNFNKNEGKYCFSSCFIYYHFKKVTNNKVEACFSRLDIILSRLLPFGYYRNMNTEKFEKKLKRKRSR